MGRKGEIVLLVMLGVLAAAILISVFTVDDPPEMQPDRSDYAARK